MSHTLPPIVPRNPPWDPDIYAAASVLEDVYRRARGLLTGENYNLHRVRSHAEAVSAQSLPLIYGLAELAETEGDQFMDWIAAVAEHYGELMVDLARAERVALGMDEAEDATIKHLDPIQIQRTGKRGRPKKKISLEFLEDAMQPSRHISLTKLASALGIHRNTLRKYLRHYRVDYAFSEISDADLDLLVKTFRETKPDSGIRYLVGFLRRHGLRVQKQRVHTSIHRVSRFTYAVRNPQRRIVRRRYSVPRPNALWHIDGHHKLILWGIVIHGCVDGYSRKIVGLRASDNNRSATVLDMFIDATRAHGVPSRLRGDRGGENKDVSILMILLRGLGRASFMWGSSTHNTRIERLWVEVGTQFARRWRAFFFRLERRHLLDRADPHHLWLLHYLFLDDINMDCNSFAAEWNAHPISGEGHDQSPEDMYFLGQLQHGVYRDELDHVDPDVLQMYYGVTSTRPLRSTPGAGNPPDEMEDVEPAAAGIASHISGNFHHAPVAVPDKRLPFSSELSIAVFQGTLQALEDQDIIPDGYGVLEEEWGAEGYPSVEYIRTGRRSGKEIRIGLPDFEWRPRAAQWARGLHAMTRVISLQMDGQLPAA